MADHPRPSKNPPPASDRPQLLKVIADGIYFETVVRLLTIGYQNQRLPVQGEVAVRDAAAAAAHEQVPPLSRPPVPQLTGRLATGVHPRDKDQEIQEWAATATNEQWEALVTKMETHWSHLARVPRELPEEIAFQAHQSAYHAYEPRTRELAKFFYIQNLRLVAVLALAEKATRTTADDNDNDNNNNNNPEERGTTTTYQQLAARMDESPKLVALCEKAATMQANAAESDLLYSYLPEPELSEPGCGANVRALRAQRKAREERKAKKAREKEAATVAYLKMQEYERAEGEAEKAEPEPEPWMLVHAVEEADEEEIPEDVLAMIDLNAKDGED